MTVSSDQTPLWRDRDGRAIFGLVLICGHDGGVATAGQRALRRVCARCGMQRAVVRAVGKEGRILENQSARQLLTPAEIGEALQRLLDQGLPLEYLAECMQKSLGWVYRCLRAAKDAKHG
jgi:hypothetical protein